MDDLLHIYLLTHCESCYNRCGIFTGRVNSRLTPEGHIHAQRLAKELAQKKIDIAYVSPLIRAKETLRHIKKYHPHMSVVVDRRLIERDYGVLSRKSKEKYKREHPDVFPLYHRSYAVIPPQGESMEQVERRVFPFIQDMLKMMQKNNSNVLVVAHSNSIRPIRKYFEHLTNDEMMRLSNLRHMVFTYHIKRGG